MDIIPFAQKNIRNREKYIYMKDSLEKKSKSEKTNMIK